MQPFALLIIFTADTLDEKFGDQKFSEILKTAL